jgi:peroxiredoxin/outer membrane lipoprotein-sorting protein
MKSLAIMAAVLVLAPASTSAQPAVDATATVLRVSETYRALSSGVFEGETGSHIALRQGDRETTPRAFSISFKRPGQARLEGKFKDGVVIIVNGDRTWDYVPASRQYMRDEKQWSLDTSLIGEYGRLSNDMTGARVLWQEEIDFDGRRVACHVVEVSYRQTGSTPQRTSSTFWIDRDRSLVLREVTMVRGTDPVSGEQVEIVNRTNWTSIRINPALPDALFVFVPGPDDTEVKTFEEPAPATMVGRRAPPFTVEQRGGDPVTLESLQGSVVILNFWATWCEPCLRGIETLDRLQREFSDQGLVLVGAGPEPADRVRNALTEQGLAVRIAEDRDGALARLYEVRGIPTTIVIDREGIIRTHVIRPQDESTWRETLAPLGIKPRQ